jgi:hypothetical protein
LEKRFIPDLDILNQNELSPQPPLSGWREIVDDIELFCACKVREIAPGLMVFQSISHVNCFDHCNSLDQDPT